jgi:hypothetical protein
MPLEDTPDLYLLISCNWSNVADAQSHDVEGDTIADD